MNELVYLSASELAPLIHRGEVSSVELTQACLERIWELNPKLNAFITVSAKEALATARRVDQLVHEGATLPPLAGVPIAVKDNIVTRGIRTTCASRILGNWQPPYDATVVQKIRQGLLPIVGKTNLDEFAMGSSTEHSAFGGTNNHWDVERVPGGSGGGSAVAVGAYLVPLALGSDTGGSIRQPAAFTGTVGMKPTYGAVSRYGLVAMASSLDQIGPVTRTVADASLLFDLIGGPDPLDSTSQPDTATDTYAKVYQSTQGSGSSRPAKLGVVRQLSGKGYESEVSRLFEETLGKLERSGVELVEVDAPSFEYALACYYLLMTAEASSNLARFDGVRYGFRASLDPEDTVEEMMRKTRGEGFGLEVKRRIILGTHVLSAGYYDAYYNSAQRVRTLIIEDFARAFEQVDALVCPTAPTVAFRHGEKVTDPMAMYLNDIATIPANLAGVPALSLPCGFSSEGLPVGIQLTTPALTEARLLELSQRVSDAIGDMDLVGRYRRLADA